ncbi:hypothetical protein MO867_22185 [Microbulbifer sp. OS29]|uniref:Uncharacterized protein n=1 Tax=Microbulbifer okhotskensis TaxID=2926617 RepID=A0A9X2ERI6_9GAMM|nr:hypothetical protein [Microbulbifer okhotskensis]MCO1337037.1 hypothetical protein [Microbulbifer okhotskensis]
MINRPKVKMKFESKSVQRIRCAECNWEQLIAAQTDADLKCCAWCGWEGLDMCQVSVQGGFQEMSCDVHGDFTVILPCHDVDPIDFMSDIFCPFCN